MQDILLSVSIPTFNRSQNLEDLLKKMHVLIDSSETPEAIELLITDNNSSDSTSKVVSEFSKNKRKYSFNSFKNNKNLGADVNFAKAIINARGEFVWILSDDDDLESDSIDILFKSLSLNRDIGFCFINYFKDPFRTLTGIRKEGGESVRKETFEEYLKEVFFSDSAIFSCVFKRSLLTEEKLLEHVGEGYLYLYWIQSILDSNPSLIIKKPLMTFVHPGVMETRKNQKKREHANDFYLEAHLGFLRYLSFLSSLDLGLSLRMKIMIYRMSVDENLNQIIYHKITSEVYSFASIKLALSVMSRRFFFSPNFWLIHFPLLILPSFFAIRFEPLRWKYLELRNVVGLIIKKIFSRNKLSRN